MREVGGAGFWVKESPELGASDAYSSWNAADLLRLMREAVAFTEARDFLWEMIEDLRREKGRLTALFEQLHAPPDPTRAAEEAGDWRAQLAPLLTDRRGGNAEALEEARRVVAARLSRVEGLWLRAYGYLQARPSTFEREAFRFAPEDVAFLHLYGSLNQIRALRFRFGDDAAMVTKRGTLLGLVEDDAGRPKLASRVKRLVDVGPQDPLLDKRELTPWDDRRPGNESVYNRLLLREGGYLAEEQLLNDAKGLRVLRNFLDVVHGNAAGKRRKDHARWMLWEVLPDLCGVLRFAILLEPAGQSGPGKASKGQAPRGDAAVTRTGAGSGAGQR